MINSSLILSKLFNYDDDDDDDDDTNDLIVEII